MSSRTSENERSKKVKVITAGGAASQRLPSQQPLSSSGGGGGRKKKKPSGSAAGNTKAQKTLEEQRRLEIENEEDMSGHQADHDNTDERLSRRSGGGGTGGGGQQQQQQHTPYRDSALVDVDIAGGGGGAGDDPGGKSSDNGNSKKPNSSPRSLGPHSLDPSMTVTSDKQHKHHELIWLFACFMGIMASFVCYGLLLEYTTSGGRKLHELSFLFVTSGLYTLTAAAGRYVRDETPTTIPPARFAVLGLTSMGSTFCSVRSLRYVHRRGIFFLMKFAWNGRRGSIAHTHLSSFLVVFLLFYRLTMQIRYLPYPSIGEELQTSAGDDHGYVSVHHF